MILSEYIKARSLEFLMNILLETSSDSEFIRKDASIRQVCRVCNIPDNILSFNLIVRLIAKELGARYQDGRLEITEL